MRWVNHKMVTATMVYSLTGGLIASVVAMSSAHLPDLLEMRGAIPHRTITHWVVAWLVFTLIALALLLTVKSWFFYILFYVGIGGMCHLAQDFLSISGIPFRSPNSKSVGLGLYKTRGEGEFITATGLTVIFLVGALMQGFFMPSHISYEINTVERLIRSFFS